MTVYGVTATGFVAEPLDDIKADIEAALKAALGNGINLIAPSVFSQLVGIMAEREFALWQMGEAVYASQYPNSASDQSLDNVCAITGATRLQPTFGTVTLTVNLNAGVTLPAGKLVSAGPNTAQWATTVPVTNSGGSPANVSVAAQCTTSGPIPALAGTLTTIVTPFSGWNTVTNPSGANPGRNLETDAALRVRRKAALSAQGSSTVNALQTALSLVPGCIQASVFANPTDVTDGNGVPPHSVECVVEIDPAKNADVRAAIWANLAAGIRPYGSTTGTIVDSQGITQEVDFSHPTEVPIWIIVNLTKNANYGGDAQVKQDLADFINALAVGVSVVDTQLYAPVFAAGGVVDITKLWIGTANPPTGPGNIAMTSRQKATCVTVDITVVSV